MEKLVRAVAVIAAITALTACTSEDVSGTSDDTGVSTTTADRLSLEVASGEVWVDLASDGGADVEDGILSIQAGATMDLTVSACPRPAMRLTNDVAEIGKVFEEDASGRTRSLQLYVPEGLPIGEYSLGTECFYSGDVGWSNPRPTVVVLPARGDGGSPLADAQPSYFCVFDAEPACEP